MKNAKIKSLLLTVAKALFFLMGLFHKAVLKASGSAIDYQSSLAEEKERLRRTAENKQK